MTGRLILFIIILMPGWFLLLRYYFFDPFVMKNIPYGLGGKKRNLLDIYLPYTRTSAAFGAEKKMKKPTGPVLIFLSGGAWIIGYKMWACLLAREFARFGYIVVCPDYRNFPQGNIEDMIADTIAAISWTKNHIELFGGDPNQIILSGQSAGAHIAACTVVHLYKCSTYVTSRFTANTTVNITKPCEKNSISQDEAMLAPAADKDGYQTPSDDDDGWEEWRSVSTVRKTQAGIGSDAASTEPEDAVAAKLTFPSDNAVDCVVDINSLAEVADELDNSFEIEPRSISESECSVSIDDIKMFVGISGPYNLKALEAHFHSRGLDSAIIEWICLGDVMKYSPTHTLAKIIGYNVPCQCLCQCMCAHESFADDAGKDVVGNPVAASVAIPAEVVAVPAELVSQHAVPVNSITKTLEGFPLVALFHGCQDLTIPAAVSTELCSVLQAGGVANPVLKLYKNSSHTDAILEGVLSGDCQLLHDMAAIMYDSMSKHPKLAGTTRPITAKLFENTEEQMKSEPRVGHLRCNIARFVNPF